MNAMVQQNLILKRFAKCHAPVCAACTYGKLTRKAWRNKPAKEYADNKRETHPGEKISVDPLVSPTPGIIAQLTRRLTTKRYKYATVFVNNYSGYGYLHIQKSSLADETIEGKNAFEKCMQSMGVQVKSRTTNNGVFRAH